MNIITKGRINRLLKKIEKYETFIQKCYGYINSTNKWITKDTKKLNKIFNTIDTDSFLSLGKNEGYLTKKDIKKIKKLRKK